MLSIIVCSKSDRMFSELSRNINDTIGKVFELIRMKDQISISSAYNEGQKKAKYDLLLYLHEDVTFHTQGWGEKLLNYFAGDPKLGCVGIAGSLIKTVAPSGWWESENSSHIHHLIQRMNNENPKLESGGWSDKEKTKEVCVIDGVFMATRKSHNIKFDTILTGFHCYDLNMAIQCKKKQLKLIITKEILLEHFSLGNVNKQWVIATHQFHKKYNNNLPLQTEGYLISPDEEANNYFNFVIKALNFKLRSIALYHWVRFFLRKPITSRHIEVLKNFIIIEAEK